MTPRIALPAALGVSPASLQADLLEFYDRHLSAGGAGRRKLSSWVYGNQHSMPTTSTPAAGMAAAVAAAATGERGGQEGEGGGQGGTAKGGVQEDGIAATADGAVADGGGGGRPVREVVTVEDYTDFKRSMPLFPLRKPTRVQVEVDVDHSKL